MKQNISKDSKVLVFNQTTDGKLIVEGTAVIRGFVPDEPVIDGVFQCYVQFDDSTTRYRRAIASDTQDAKQAFNEMFYDAYHSNDMGNSVKEFLRVSFPTMQDSRHLSSMRHFCNLIAEKDTDNVHPAIFGMLCEAWRQFLAEL